MTAMTAVTTTINNNMPIILPKIAPPVKPAKRENENKHKKVPSWHQHAKTHNVNNLSQPEGFATTYTWTTIRPLQHHSTPSASGQTGQDASGPLPGVFDFQLPH